MFDLREREREREREMSKTNEQMVQKTEPKEQKNAALEGLPLESSPYVKYSNLEDYKLNAYGTEGHLDPKLDQRGSATDAPTLSGSCVLEGKASTFDATNRWGMPYYHER